MKRIFVLLMTALLLTGCGVAEGSNSELPQTATEKTSFELNGGNVPLEDAREVHYELNYVRMSLSLPESWDYAYVGIGADDGEIHVPPADRVGLRIWPKEGGGVEASLTLLHYQDAFAMCGTGLETQEIELDSGLTGAVGFYDGNPMWSFIRLYDTPGSYVIRNEGADVWWEDYREQAVAILHSVRAGEGLLKESEAEEIAKTVCNVDYNTVRPAFDRDSGEWEIHFYLDSSPGGGQTVWISPEGEILKTESGE